MLLGVNIVQSWWSWIPVCQQISFNNPVTSCHSYDPSSLLALDRMEALEGPQRSISVGGALRSPSMIVRRTMSATCNFYSFLSCTFNVAVDYLSCTTYVAVDLPISIIRIGQDSDNISLVHGDIDCPRRSHYRYQVRRLHVPLLSTLYHFINHIAFVNDDTYTLELFNSFV